MVTITNSLLQRVATEARAEEYRQSFHLFAERAWSEVDPAPLVRGWFIDLLWDELEAWGKGDDPSRHRQMIMVPPGSSKSLSASVLLQAWMWTREPDFSLLAYCSTQDLAVRDNLRMRDLVTSDWYREHFWRGWELHQSQHQKKRFRNTAMGERYGIGGLNRPTGWRGKCILIDDPVDANPRKPPRPEDLEAAYNAVQYLLRTRKNQQDPMGAKALLIMQRLADGDPAGRLLQAEASRWHTVCFDALFDPAMPHRHPKDPRTTPGEVLLPEMGQTQQGLEDDKIALGSDMFNAQFQQQPSQAAGMIIKPHWFSTYETLPDNLPYTIISWDCAFKGEDTSSWVVGSVWKVDSPQDPHKRAFYLVDVLREHLDYGGTKAAIERLALRYPETDYVVIEDKANGPAVISELRYKIPNIVAFNPAPYGDKTQRLRASSPVFEQGRVFIPAPDGWLDALAKNHPLPDGAPNWLAEYCKEITRAPKVSDWDQVDTTTQVVLGSIYEMPTWQKSVKGKDVKIFWI